MSEVVLVRALFPAGTSTNPVYAGKHIPVAPHELVHSYDEVCEAAVLAGNSAVCHRNAPPVDGYFAACGHRFPDCAIPQDPLLALSHQNLLQEARRMGLLTPHKADARLTAHPAA